MKYLMAAAVHNNIRIRITRPTAAAVRMDRRGAVINNNCHKELSLSYHQAQVSGRSTLEWTGRSMHDLLALSTAASIQLFLPIAGVCVLA